MKLTNISEIKGKIILKSGLHIGAGDMEMHIGGTDNPVIKHPHTLEPYIPGSSLKGKVRALLELRSGLMAKTGGSPLSAKDLKNLSEEQKPECEKILKIFGASGAGADEMAELGPTRVSFADCPLNQDWRRKAGEKRLQLTEVKAETAIDRVSGTAKHGSLRSIERVPANTKFDFSVTLKQFEGEEDLLDYLLGGLKLLEMDALGGNGSRGYGRIAFEFEDEQIGNKFQGISLF